MKVKKILLGGLVLVFAIGSAVAAAFQPERVHVVGKTITNPNVFQCVPTNVFCDTQGSFDCLVNIPVNGSNTIVYGYKGPGSVTPETLCTTRLRRNIPTPIAGTPFVTILEVHPWDIPNNN